MKNIGVNFLRNVNFCQTCGKKLKKEKENLLTCSMEHHTYINPAPTNAAIILNSKEEIMLVKRRIEPKKGYWDLPGGFIDLNETAEESMVRELREELGININPQNLKYFSSFYDEYEYKEIIYPTISFVFSIKITDKRFIPKDDVSEIKFFKLSELPRKKIAFESITLALKKFLKENTRK